MHYIYDKPISNIIRNRHSVRTYENKDIPKDILLKIEDYIKEVEKPFGTKVKIKLIKNGTKESNMEKLGTYGVIKNAQYFLAVACEKGDMDLEGLGYAFEKVVLYCTSLGLGTCWMAGTYDKSGFVNKMDLKDDEKLLVVSPLGYEAAKKSIVAKVFGVNSGKRKGFGEVFFEKDFNIPLKMENAHEFGEILENVRLSPSAVNKQPWRILQDNEGYHFYIDKDSEHKKMDIGIAICHFHLSCIESGINGYFKRIGTNIKSQNKYVISWIKEK